MRIATNCNGRGAMRRRNAKFVPSFRRLLRCGAIVLAVAGCSQPNPTVTVVASGDTVGWITPCGCASNQSGGLLRRATLIESAGNPDHILYLDAGGSAAGTTEYQRLKLEAILRGLASMDLAAHNIGAPEAELDPEQLATLADRTGVTWVSANLRSAVGPSPARQSVVVERGGLRIAVAGVVDPARITNENWSARDAVPAALGAVRELDADVRILLAYFDEAGLRNLAQSLPEFDFIIGGPTGQALKPEVIGPVHLISATNKGKFLARIEVTRGKSKPFELATIGPAEVTSDLPENETQAANLARYYSELATRDFTAAEAGLAQALHSDNADHIAGSDSCAKCHAADQATWHKSRHSHAFDVLVAKRAHVDPYCQQCHTTGYGHAGGFVSANRTPQIVHVGCENCHGPSARHVADPKIRTPYLAREQCLRCHDHENSPHFNYDTYWAKIRHGPPTSPPSSRAE